MKHKTQTQIKIELSIFGDVFNPNFLTKKIKIEPTSTCIKGDKTEYNALSKQSSWRYSTGFVETLFFENVASILMENFSNREVAIIKEIVNLYKLDIKLFVVVEIYDEQPPALFFNKSFLNFLNKLDAEVDLDMYII